MLFDVDVSDTLSVTESVSTDTVFADDPTSFRSVGYGAVWGRSWAAGDQIGESYSLELQDTLTVSDEQSVQLFTPGGAFYDITVNEVSLSIVDSTEREVESFFGDVVSVTDTVARAMAFDRNLSDAIDISDSLENPSSFERSANDTISLTDSASAILTPGVFADSITITDTTKAEVVLPEHIVIDSSGFILTVPLPGEIRYDHLQESGNFLFMPLSGGVPFQAETVEAVVTATQTGSTGQVVYQGGQQFFSPLFRISGASDSEDSIVDGTNVELDESLSLSDSYKIELLGADPVEYFNGFMSGDVDSYIEILNGIAPGTYRIVSVLDIATVVLDRPLPVVDSANGQLSWRLTSAVQLLKIHLTNKATNNSEYAFLAKRLVTRAGSPLLGYRTTFTTASILGPKVLGADLNEDGVIVVQYDQEMRSDQAFVAPSEYTVTGPTDVSVAKTWSLSPTSVALQTTGLESGSYTLEVNTSGTPKDVAGNPTDPSFNEAIFSGITPLNIRSVFTDKGPIAKPELILQSGVGATIDEISEVTLPGASLNGTHVGKYVRLGYMGTTPTTSSSVIGTDVTITDTVSVTDALKIEVFGATSSRTAYTSLSGTYKVLGILSSTEVKLQASFTLPEASSGVLYWQLIDPRNGEIADDPADVQVTVNGAIVTPDAVIGLLGQVVLPTIPASADEVKIDYSWCCNPNVEIRRLNSREFRLNSWDRDVGYDANPTQHKYRYNNTLVRPSDYEPLDMLATLDQPLLRELHYRAYERAYTPVLNDPSLLLLNSPTHRIAFPSAQRTLSEKFVNYEATVLPENDSAPWTRHGVGATSVSAGVLTVIDNTSGVFPYGQPIFWTQTLDLTFPHVFAMSWRFFVSATPVQDGDFTGVAAGYTDETAAYVVGFLNVSGVKKVGFLKRGSGDVPALATSWTGGLDGGGLPTDAATDLDWSVIRSYRILRDTGGTVKLFVDGNIVETLRITQVEAPFLEELNAPFDEIQGAFFGSVSRPAESTSKWDFVRYLILPTNPIQTSPSSYVNYEGTVHPELDAKPWTPIGFHGTETILSDDYLLLDSTSATDASTEAQVGLIGGDFKGFVRIEPLLTSASQVVVDASVQLLTQTHGVDPYGLMFAVDDGTRLMQVAFLASSNTPKLSYGGRSFPEDFSPYAWSSMGTAIAEMEGRSLRITDTDVGDGRVYFIEDLAPAASDDRVLAAATDYYLEFRNKVLSYTVDGSGFAGAFAQAYDGTRSVGLLFAEIAGTRYVYMHSDGVFIAPFEFDWGDGDYHTYRLAKNTFGDLVSLFIDGVFIGTENYSSFTAAVGTAMLSFGSSTASSAAALSEIDWAYCNAWRTRSDLKRYVGIWKGYDQNSLTGYHLPLKASGVGAQVVGNALGDPLGDFSTVSAGDALVVDYGPNKGVYEVAAVSTMTTLTIIGTWPFGPTLADYRIIKETDWATPHKYRLMRDSTGEVSLLFDTDTDPLIRIGYNSLDLPESGVGIVRTLSSGLAAIAFGSFSPENLEQSLWDYFRYGVTRSPTERRIVPHHQVLNQWNVMESPERLYTALPHELTSFKSSSTGIVPRKDPDFLRDPGLTAFTLLNEATPLVPSTQTFEVRAPYPIQEYVSALNSPEDVLNNDGDFTLNDGSIRYRLIVPDDVLYSSLDVIEQTTGEDGLIAPFGESCGPKFGGLKYQREICLTYTADVLPEDDTSAPTPWVRESDVPSDVLAMISSGVLSYKTIGSKTVYKNNTPLPDAPGLITEVKFRLKLVDDASLGVGDTKVRFGLSAPGMTLALAFVTSALAERYVVVVDLNNGKHLGSFSYDFLDGAFHEYRIMRDPGAGVVRVFIDS